MLTRRALLSRTAHAFAGAALASMMRWWPKQEEETLEISASIGTGYATLTVVYLDAYGKVCEEPVELPVYGEWSTPSGREVLGIRAPR